eukprot:3102209-Rhodomonas_salina.2
MVGMRASALWVTRRSSISSSGCRILQVVMRVTSVDPREGSRLGREHCEMKGKQPQGQGS